MGSKTVLASLKKAAVVKGSKAVDSDEDMTDGSESTSNNGDSSADGSEEMSDLSVNESGSDEEDASEMDEEEEVTSASEDDESIDIDEEGSGSEMDEDQSDNMNESGDGKTVSFSGRVIAAGDGVDLSDDNNSEAELDGDSVEDADSNNVKVAANPAWAQAMAKILRTQKPPRKKTVVLSKARTIPAAEAAAARKTGELDFEVVGESDVKPVVKDEADVKPTAEELVLARRERLSYQRIKPEDFDWNRERALGKIATKGVVQLFNAVRAQQKNLGNRLAEAHSTRMEDRLLQSIDKDAFLQHLTGKIRSRRIDEVTKEVKTEKVGTMVLPKSWDELSKSVQSSNDKNVWDNVITIKDEPEE